MTYDPMLKQAYLDAVLDPRTKQAAEDESGELIKNRLRGEGLLRRIMPVDPLTKDDLDKNIDTDHPVKIYWMEPDVVGGAMIGFDGMPEAQPIKGGRFAVTLKKIQSQQMGDSTLRLMAYPYDIRQILSDQIAKDLLDIEDVAFFDAVNACLGVADNPSPVSGDVQYRTFYGGWTNDAIQESFKIMGEAGGKFEPKLIVFNHTSRKDFHKWTRNEWGSDVATDMVMKGFSEEEFQNAKVRTTIKDHIVPSGSMFFFADADCIGKFAMLQDLVMNVERKREYIVWDVNELVGGSIANAWGLARADYA